MKKRGLTRFSKIVIILQIVIVVGALFLITFFSPKQNYPYDGEIFENNIIDFNFKNANVILIDENPGFSSPEKLNSNDIESRKIILPPGTYYWKALGLFESSTRNFTVNSKVGLEFDNFKLENVGNVPLNVSARNSKGVTGLMILDVQIEYPTINKNNSEYRGEIYEKK